MPTASGTGGSIRVRDRVTKSEGTLRSTGVVTENGRKVYLYHLISGGVYTELRSHRGLLFLFRGNIGSPGSLADLLC